MSRRTVFYLIRLAPGEPVPVARFTDRAEATRAVRAFERLGWLGELRRRQEGGAGDDGPWEHDHRSAVRRRGRAKAGRSRARGDGRAERALP